MSRLRTGIGAAALIAVLVGCGGGGDDDEPGSSTTATSTTAVSSPSEDAISGDDVCSLLTSAQLDDLAAAGAPWSEGVASDGSCTWDAGPGGSLTVTVTPDVEATLDDVRTSSSGGRAVEELDVFASGAVGVYDAEGALVEAHAPAGSDEVVAVIVEGVDLDEDVTLAVLEAGALAWENRGSGTSTSDAGVAAVRFEVRSDGAGLDLDFEVTAEQVADSPGSNQILCSGVDPDVSEGLFEGVYSVLGIDITRPEGLVNASVAADAVEGPGTYPGQFEAGDSEGRTISVDGEVEIDDGLTSGTFRGTDDAGNDVTVTFECER